MKWMIARGTPIFGHLHFGDCSLSNSITFQWHKSPSNLHVITEFLVIHLLPGEGWRSFCWSAEYIRNISEWFGTRNRGSPSSICFYEFIIWGLWKNRLHENGSCAGLGRTLRVSCANTVPLSFWLSIFSCPFFGARFHVVSYSVYRFHILSSGFPFNPKWNRRIIRCSTHDVRVSSYQNISVPFVLPIYTLYVHFHVCLFDRAAWTTGQLWT